MKVVIAKEHRDFFQKEGYILFDSLISEKEILLLKKNIKETLIKRTSEKTKSAQIQFDKGRDLFRDSEEIRHFVCLPKLAEIASELVEKKPIRLAFDQYLPALTKDLLISDEPYLRFIQKEAHLQALSSIKGLLCGVLIRLESEKPDQLLFFDTQRNFQLEPYLTDAAFLIVYTKQLSYYKLNEEDPHRAALKHVGYIEHDQLNDKCNPIVYR